MTRWTLCHGCLLPVDVRELAPERPSYGASWDYTCPACEWYTDADQCHKIEDTTKDAPPPPDPIALLMAIVLPVVARVGRDAVVAAIDAGVTA